jgi:hypothetical protein
MNETAVLIALGPNSVEVPCRLFPDMATALARCTELFGRGPTRTNKDGSYQWGYDKETKWDICKLLESREDARGDMEESPLTKQLFTHYYGGCGEVGAFDLKAVPFDSTFVGFDLD